jgi:hypothetical protein
MKKAVEGGFEEVKISCYDAKDRSMMSQKKAQVMSTMPSK